MTTWSSELEMISWTRIVEHILSYSYDLLQNVFATENFKKRRLKWYVIGSDINILLL